MGRCDVNSVMLWLCDVIRREAKYDYKWMKGLTYYAYSVCAPACPSLRIPRPHLGSGSSTRGATLAVTALR